MSNKCKCIVIYNIRYLPLLRNVPISSCRAIQTANTVESAFHKISITLLIQCKATANVLAFVNIEIPLAHRMRFDLSDWYSPSLIVKFYIQYTDTVGKMFHLVQSLLSQCKFPMP